MITNSTIGAPVSISELDPLELDFKITIANVQQDKNCLEDDDKKDTCNDQCYFDYMGMVKISMNRFSILNKESITILNAKKFEFFGNTADLVLDNALHVANVKNLNISENRFEFIGETPIMKIVYQYSAYELGSNDDFFPDDFSRDFDKSLFSDECEKKECADAGDDKKLSDCTTEEKKDMKDYASMSKSDIEAANIAKNFFGRFKKETIKYIIDDSYEFYSKDFVVDKFAPKEISSRTPCQCPIPKPTDDDAYEMEKPEKISNHLTMIGLMKEDCLSPQYPPVMGKREDICNGKYPKPIKDRLEDAKKGIKPWHLILAILLSIMITAIVVFVIVRFCCTPEESKSRAVSPNP